MAQSRAFTLIEILVVVAIIMLLVAILLPVLGEARTSARQVQSSAQLRGIHQGFVTYSPGRQAKDGFLSAE